MVERTGRASRCTDVVAGSTIQTTSRLRAEPDLCVGDNEPYGGHLPGDAIARHAIAHERPNVLIELRNDLIATPAQQAAWAARLAPILTEVAGKVGV